MLQCTDMVLTFLSALLLSPLVLMFLYKQDNEILVVLFCQYLWTVFKVGSAIVHGLRLSSYLNKNMCSAAFINSRSL